MMKGKRSEMPPLGRPADWSTDHCVRQLTRSFHRLGLSRLVPGGSVASQADILKSVFDQCVGKTIKVMFVPETEAGLRIVFTDGTGFRLEAEYGRLAMLDLTDEDLRRAGSL